MGSQVEVSDRKLKAIERALEETDRRREEAKPPAPNEAGSTRRR